MDKKEDESDIVRTDIDRFYSLIKKEQNIEIEKAVQDLGIELELIERYAEILSKNDKVIVNYPMIGKANVKAKGNTQKEVKEKAEEATEVFVMITTNPGIKAKKIARKLNLEEKKVDELTKMLKEHDKIYEKKGLFGSVKWYKR